MGKFTYNLNFYYQLTFQLNINILEENFEKVFFCIESGDINIRSVFFGELVT